MQRPRAVVALVVLGLVTTACSSKASGGASATPQSAQATQSAGVASPPTAQPVGGVKSKRSVAGVETEIEVGPAYRIKQGILLPVQVAGQQVAEPVDINSAWSGEAVLPDTSGLAIVDFAGGTVLPSTPGAFQPSLSFGGENGDLVTYALFGPSSGQTIDVLVPLVGLVTDVPVVEGPAPQQAADFIAAIDQNEIVREPQPLHEYRAALGEAYDLSASNGGLELNVAADFLFAVDSAELSAQADETLRALLGKLKPFAGGNLRIVGHTDSNGEEAHNQDLSERRAQAVHDRLQALEPLERFTVSVEGRGESQPRVAETDDGARQLNRRVELVVEGEGATTVLTTPAPATPGSAPASATTGSGTVQVLTDVTGQTVEVQVTSLRRRGKYLVGELSVRCPKCTEDFLWRPFSRALAASAHRDNQPTGPFNTAAHLALLTGNERVYPVEYSRGQGMLPLTDPNLYRVLDEPNTRQFTVTAVWPDLGTEKVTIDVDGERTDAESWRISEIPVTD